MGCKISKGKPSLNESDGNVSSSVEGLGGESRESVLSSTFVYNSSSASNMGQDSDGGKRSGSKYKYIVAKERSNTDQPASVILDSLRLGANLVGLNLQASALDTGENESIRNC